MKFGVVAVCVVVYALLVAVGAANHEPWADEAQAWLLARDNSWMELQWQYLRHEGAPGLWHTVLYLPARLGLPYEESLAAAAAIFAVAGVTLFLWYSPLPLWLSALVPFSFFVLYQYAIVARSYSLLLPLLPLAAHFLKAWATRPLRLSAVLVLLSHVSVHGALLSLAFMAQIAFDAYRRRDEYRSWAVGHIAGGLALYFVNGITLVLLLRPPPDLAFAMAGSAGVEALVEAVHHAGFAFAGHRPPMPLQLVAVVLGFLTLFWAALRGAIFGLLAALMLSALAGLTYANAWHEGVLFLAWIFGLWIAWHRVRAPMDAFRRGAATTATAAILALHVYYGLATWRLDSSETYSGAREAARYLKEHQNEQQSIWGFDFATVAIQPYFERPVFANYADADRGKAFWLWSTRNLPASLPPRSETLCKGKPDRILTVRESRYPQKFRLEDFETCGYEIEREFSGTIFFQGQRLNVMTYVLLRRRPQDP